MLLKLTFANMKRSTAFLLSTYLMAISLLPCGDVCGGIVHLMESWLEVVHEAHPDHEQHSGTCKDDPCSPLCGCSCCSIVLDVPVRLIVLSPKSDVLNAHVSDFVTSWNEQLFPRKLLDPPRS